MFEKLFESLNEGTGIGIYFGITEAGWIHSNGEREELPNYSAGDHDMDAYKKLSKHDPKISEDKAYNKYLEQGHIRYIQSKHGFNIELRRKPTVSQMKAIRNGIKEGTGEFYFSIRTGSSYRSDGRSWQEFREEFR